jgi:hypothetical protein
MSQSLRHGSDVVEEIRAPSAYIHAVTQLIMRYVHVGS